VRFSDKTFFQWFDYSLLAILLVFGLVAVLLTGGSALHLRIVPTLAIGLTILLGILWWGRQRTFAAKTPENPTEWKLLWTLLAIGVTLRLLWWLLIHSQLVLQSDFAVYFNSAEHMAKFWEYRVFEREGLLIAYRPPGTVFLLSLVMMITGIVSWAPVALNLFYFTATGWLLWKTIRPKVTQAAALGALSLFTFWPSDIMFASLPQSENPTLLGIALLMFLATRRQANPRLWEMTTGLLTGLLCLVRNSNLLLTGLWSLVALRSPQPWSKRIVSCTLIALFTFLPILPWTYRNFRMLGSPVLVATNGGENLYSANNDVTDGGWDPTVSGVRIYLPDELKMDRIAKQLAIDWIRTHPLKFLKLAVNKLRILMSDDNQGPYDTLERGIGYTGPGLLAAQLIANFWWLLLWGLVLTSLRYYSLWRDDPDAYIMLALATIPSLLFLIFQSQSRYHVPMVPPLLFLAAYTLSFRSRSQDPR